MTTFSHQFLLLLPTYPSPVPLIYCHNAACSLNLHGSASRARYIFLCHPHYKNSPLEWAAISQELLHLLPMATPQNATTCKKIKLVGQQVIPHTLHFHNLPHCNQHDSLQGLSSNNVIIFGPNPYLLSPLQLSASQAVTTCQAEREILYKPLLPPCTQTPVVGRNLFWWWLLLAVLTYTKNIFASLFVEFSL